MPVAVTPPQGNVTAAPIQLTPQVTQQTAVAFIDGGNPAKKLIVLTYLQQAFIRHAAPARSVTHKRQYILGPIRSAVGQQHDRVIGRK